MLVSLSDVLTSEGKVETVAIPLEMTSFKSRQGEFPITEKTPITPLSYPDSAHPAQTHPALPHHRIHLSGLQTL